MGLPASDDEEVPGRDGHGSVLVEPASEAQLERASEHTHLRGLSVMVGGRPQAPR